MIIHLLPFFYHIAMILFVSQNSISTIYVLTSEYNQFCYRKKNYVVFQ